MSRRSATAFAVLIAVSLFTVTSAGCSSTKTSNTPRTAREQMLLSNAVDQSLNKIDFSPLGGQRVFIDETWLDAVDKKYIVGSLRHRILLAGAQLTTGADDADVVMEVRSGGVGTDSSESFVGIPEVTLPGMLTLPEIRIAERRSQYGYAKLGLVLRDAQSGRALGSGGMSLAQADDNNWHVLGVGPLQTGSLRSDVELATTPARGMPHRQLPNRVAFATPTPASGDASQDFQFASESRDSTDQP